MSDREEIDIALAFMESMHGPGISGSMKDSALESAEKIIRGQISRIAELEAEVSYLRTREKSQGAYIEQVLDELEAENERLLEVLERIATKRHSYKHEAHNCDHRAALDSCIDIAKNALAEND